MGLKDPKGQVACPRCKEWYSEPLTASQITKQSLECLYSLPAFTRLRYSKMSHYFSSILHPQVFLNTEKKPKFFK